MYIVIIGYGRLGITIARKLAKGDIYMKAMVIGGGKVGYYLLKTLQEKGYKTVVIKRAYTIEN